MKNRDQIVSPFSIDNRTDLSRTRNPKPTFIFFIHPPLGGAGSIAQGEAQQPFLIHAWGGTGKEGLVFVAKFIGKLDHSYHETRIVGMYQNAINKK